VGDDAHPGLQRHFGLVQATALNVTMIVGAGVFITIPLMLQKLPGPYAVLGWVGAGALILVDGLIWGELAATLPGSGGTYLYLLECFGRERWGRLMAFLFIWQFLISGPLEVASALIAIAQFSLALSPGFASFNQSHQVYWPLVPWVEGSDLALIVNPARLGAVVLGVLILVLLYRRITTLGRLTVTLWLGVLGIIAWFFLVGMAHFQPSVAFNFSGPKARLPDNLVLNLGQAMILAMYSYLGYYHVCYIGDEVRDPARTIPRAVLLSALVVCVLFCGLHLAMLGTVPWQDVPTEPEELANYTLPAEFMSRVYPGTWAPALVSLMLIWSCFGSAFAALLGYSRIPYGAARYGHFFAALGRVHPVHRIPHVSLVLVGVMTLLWSFFDLQSVINALITTRILEQFVGQILGVMWLRRTQPNRPRPFRIWLYPLPCLVALAGWLYLYVCAGWLFIILGLATLLAGGGAFVVWSRATGTWPFATPGD